MWMTERRDFRRRGRVVERLVAVLRASDVVSVSTLARAADTIPEWVAAGMIRRFALRGLVRNIAHNRWSATAALRRLPLLKIVSDRAVISASARALLHGAWLRRPEKRKDV